MKINVLSLFFDSGIVALSLSKRPFLENIYVKGTSKTQNIDYRDKDFNTKVYGTSVIKMQRDCNYSKIGISWL